MAPERIQVLLVTGADLRRGAPGGTRSYVLGLAQYLARRGLAIGILSNGPSEDIPPGVRLLPASDEHIPSTLAFQRRLRAWSRDADWKGVGLLHFQRPDDLLSLHATRLPPAVCTLHGDAARGVRRRRGRLAALAYLRHEAEAVPRFRTLVAVHDDVATEYRRRYPEASARIVTISVAVDDAFLARSREARPSGSPTFLFVGRLSAEKRVDRIIEAFRGSGLPGAHLLVVGSGPAAQRLRVIADDADVEFLGTVPHDALVGLYQKADGLILASEFEGLPTVALEALASGCPVVALTGCGLDSILTEKRGILVEDAAAMTAAFSACLELRRSRAGVSVPDQYTWASVGERVLEVYRSAAPEVVS